MDDVRLQCSWVKFLESYDILCSHDGLIVGLLVREQNLERKEPVNEELFHIRPSVVTIRPSIHLINPVECLIQSIDDRIRFLTLLQMRFERLEVKSEEIILRIWNNTLIRNHLDHIVDFSLLTEITEILSPNFIITVEESDVVIIDSCNIL